jgi:hypothetical protein
MKAIENYKGEEIAQVGIYYSHQLVGHGHWNINSEVTIGRGEGYINGATKNFKVLVYADFVDGLSDLKSEDPGSDAIQAYYDAKAWDEIEESVTEWVEYMLEKFAEEESEEF